MLLLSTHRRLALAGALIAALTLAGSAAAGSPPHSSHASSTAVTHAAAGTDSDSGDDTPDASHPDAGNTVSAAAQTDTVGGAHQNHGGYVSCVARGGSNCTTSSPTLPSHGKPANPGGSAPTH